MFDGEVDNGPSSVAMMLAHQVIAILISPCAILLTAIATKALRLPMPVAAVGVLLSYLAGFPCGYYFPKSESSRSAAGLAWVLPSTVYALLFIAESRQFGFSQAGAYFFALNPTDNETLATLFFTLPTCSAVTYSLGAFTRAHS